jgi:hypothetical protein
MEVSGSGHSSAIIHSFSLHPGLSRPITLLLLALDAPKAVNHRKVIQINT